jgi:hypothetical protein
MKKPSRTLALRSETLRILDNMGLARVAGGDGSNRKQCIGVEVQDSVNKQCFNVVVSAFGDKQSP